MSYKDEFNDANGWSVVDVSTRLNTKNGKKFLAFLRKKGVHTIIRYYASSARSKTLTIEEAKILSSEGFGILPIFQDSSRSISNFSSTKGTENAKSAMDFAKKIGQPKNKGSTILFAVDADYAANEIDGPILDYFKAIHEQINGTYSIGAYGSGAVLSKLLHEHLITVPWLSMSRGFLGTQPFFNNKQWSIRQVPPSIEHPQFGIEYDQNIIRIPQQELGAFQIKEIGEGYLLWDTEEDATLGNRAVSSIQDESLGTTRIISTEGTRFRKAPNGTIIRNLTIGDHVVDLGASENGWHKVKIKDEEGFVYGNYLRKPNRPEIETLLRCAFDEWLRFDKGYASEKNDPFYKYVREMWAALGEPYDGLSKYENGEDVPWSAAFISWIVRKAGKPYANFQFTSSHSVFVNNAIKARITNRLDKPFWGYRINEKKPELGDIIQRNRSANNFTYSYAENHSQYISHSDIVVEVTPDVVRVLGGNVSNTVNMGTDLQEYEIDSDGYLKPNQKIICLLKNQAGLTN